MTRNQAVPAASLDGLVDACRRRSCWDDLAGARVLIVDDEITTGHTLTNLVTVLRNSGVEVTGIACMIEDTTGNARPLLESLGVPLCTLTRL